MYRDKEIEELFPFYALDAVTEEEREQVLRYISSNAEAKVRLEEEMALASEMALTVKPIMPSPAVKSNVMAYAAAHPKQTAVLPKREPMLVSRQREGSSLSLLEKLQQFLFFPAVTGVAAALAILLLIWNFNLQRTIDSLQGEVTALREEAAEQDAILAMLPSGSSIPILGTEVEPNSTAQLVVAKNGLDAVLFVSSLTRLPSDQVYQLWYIGDDGPVSRGTFAVDESGKGQLNFHSETAVTDFAAIGISIEPEGGSEQPTGDIVLLGDIPASKDT